MVIASPARSDTTYFIGIPIPIVIPARPDPVREARRERLEYLRQNAGRETTFKPSDSNPWGAEAGNRSFRPKPTEDVEIRPEFRESSQVRPEFSAGGRALSPTK